MAAKEVAVKKYVVRSSADERAQLNDLIRKGKRSAQLLTKARILLKADVSEAGEGWSDSRIAEAVDTSIANILRTRRQLVEEGFEAVLTRKYNANSARPRIFDGVAEANLIALACGPAPEGHAKWSLRLLEEKVVELHIVERASDNTIGRTLKKNTLKPHLKQQWTSHGLSSAFLGFQAGVEQRLVFEHSAGDIEKTVADGAQCTGMGTAAGFQSEILGFALLIASSGGISQVVNGIPQSWIAGEPSGDGAAFARSPGDGGHAAQFA